MDSDRLVLVLIMLISVLVPTLQVCFKAKLPNGRVKLRRRGRMVIYRCRRGFQVYGSKIALCRLDTWSHPPPKCIAPGCPDVVPSPGLVMKPELNRAKMSFSCQDTFDLQGPTEIFCNKVSWDKPPPVCQATSSLLSCDFEQPDLCGWSQADNDDFDWSRHSGQTQSGNTGPPYDHTYGILKKGYYLYMETSSPRKPDDQADLLSPVYLPDHSDQCFEFWYHMLGTEVGSVDVFVKPESQEFDSVNSSFHVVGDHGNQWLRGEITIPPLVENFQIVIRGKRLKGFASDIAIDDVRLYNCSEEITTRSTSVVPSTTTEPATTATITVRTRSTTTTPPVTTTGSAITSLVTRQPTTTSPTTAPTQRPTTIRRPRTTTRRQTTKTTVKPRRTSPALKTQKPTRPTRTPRPTRPTRPTRTPRPTRPTPPTRTPRPTKPTKSTTVRPRRTTTMRRTRRPKTTKRPRVTKPAIRTKTPTTTTILPNATGSKITNYTMSFTTLKPKRTNRTTRVMTPPASNVSVTKPEMTTMDLYNSSADFGNNTNEPVPGKKSDTTNMNDLIPLAIGIGGGVLFVIIISVILVSIWAKKKKQREVEPYEELEPITKSMSKTSLNLNLVNDYNIENE